jgi:hypothetical protein
LNEWVLNEYPNACLLRFTYCISFMRQKVKHFDLFLSSKIKIIYFQ